jgi:hypothetical protein
LATALAAVAICNGRHADLVAHGHGAERVFVHVVRTVDAARARPESSPIASPKPKRYVARQPIGADAQSRLDGADVARVDDHVLERRDADAVRVVDDPGYPAVMQPGFVSMRSVGTTTPP